MSVDSLVITVKEFGEVQNAFYAYLAGLLDSWAIIIEENPEMISTVSNDMKQLATNLKKISGVTIANL